ncbi:MAG TPA: XrtA system polysaccharide deacetylase [Gammaproteobacteria bacterium]|nr:XrtA system polysaccharide deacetylase [Gammaproteobacteria bacterium]
MNALPKLLQVDAPPIVNALTIDVEDYYQVSALEPYIRRDNWTKIPPRVEANTDRILALLDEHGIRATFFVLGWIAERHADLVRRIAAAGHEVASHGYAHMRITQQSPAEFHDDVVRAKSLLEDTIGEAVKGYRAPSYSIGATTLWALDILDAAGYRYSSSIFPIRHDLYGMPSAPRFPFYARAGGILEIPVTTVKIGRRKLPCGGGGYFRLLPYATFRWALRRVNDADGRAGVFYFHPWEIDPEQPRVAGTNFKTRFRHYVNLDRMEAKIVRLLGDFHWDRMDRVFLEDAAAYSSVQPTTAAAVPTVT